jgi:Zn-dependent M16 (insulinase) family peptidase
MLDPMNRHRFLVTLLLLAILISFQALAQNLSALKKDQSIGDLRVSNLYADADGTIVGIKFRHVPTGAPIYLLQIETVPQAFIWVDAPDSSNRGLAHSLEHLLAGKGTKGRYLTSLTDMRLSKMVAASHQDYNFYSFSSGTGLPGFFDQFHAWLEALFKPDFSDLEAEREFYHFGLSSNSQAKTKTLIEEGAVYDEMQVDQGAYTYFFDMNKRVFGARNPFGFYIGGIPEEMRQVTPQDIRHFYNDHYHLGPTTGLILVLHPKEDVSSFVQRISQELRPFSGASQPSARVTSRSQEPKYPIEPDADTNVKVFPFPSARNTDRGEVRFAWKPQQTQSQTDLRFLQLFFQALTDGDESVLYKSFVDSKTRELESGATSLESTVFLEDSPNFPGIFVHVLGIPGNRITVERVEQLRHILLDKIEQISKYPDDSKALTAFNQLVASYAEGRHRSERVWVKNAPRFGLDYRTDWKEHLSYLEMDSSFIRSLTDENIWHEIERQLKSGKNIWRGVIECFHLMEMPYANAAVPSPQLLDEIEKGRQNRIRGKISQIMARFDTKDEQEALVQFEHEEISKTKEIEEIAQKVVHPKFSAHPPLTLDDDIRYKQFRLESVPVIAALFDRVPSIDLGLSFDLRALPQKYYKYLPILPRCLDSLGLKTGNQVLTYSDVSIQIQKQLNDFSIAYESNPISRRADLTIRVSATNAEDFRIALSLIHRMMNSNYLDLSNVDRLRDLVDQRLGLDDAWDKRAHPGWFANPAIVFRYQDDPLYLALYSQFTRAHWDSRLKWLLHQPVPAEEIAELGRFADDFLRSAAGMSAKDFSLKLAQSSNEGLRGELLEYWEKSISAFSEQDLMSGLKQLTSEVQEDLKTGPARTIDDIRELQRLLLSRNGLKIDITADETVLGNAQHYLSDLLKSIPAGSEIRKNNSLASRDHSPIISHLEKRYRLSGDDYPWYLAIEDPRSTTGGMGFYAEFPGYSKSDRRSLLEVLSSKLLSGIGPHTAFMKAREAGLAYDSSITTDSNRSLMWYYAERCPDIPVVIELVNSVAHSTTSLRDPSLIDYALEHTFPLPRSMSTFSERGRGIARDLRDGNDPDKVRRFSEGILKLREDPNLLEKLTRTAQEATAPVLLDPDFIQQQRQARSVFLFVGPQRILADAEKRLRVPKLLRLYLSDFWLQLSADTEANTTTGAR